MSKGTAWLQVRATRNAYSGRVDGFKIAKVTQNEPEWVTDADVRLIKISLSIPLDLWDPLTLLVDVPAEAIRRPEIAASVEAETSEEAGA